MLLVLYGATTESGFKSRQFLNDNGYKLIEKLCYASDHVVAVTRYGERKWVSKEEFYSRTDSLFRYEVGGINVGFNQSQILDAVSNNANKLLTLSSPDISFLREIKKVYGDSVQIIYLYIDENTLKQIVSDLPNLTQEEEQYRLETGRNVRRQYSLNSDIFDHVVIYAGENSEFDLNLLIKQYKGILDSLDSGKNTYKTYDVYLSYSRYDIHAARMICDKLSYNNIDVFNNGDLYGNIAEAIKNAILSSKVFVPIISKEAINSPCVEMEINTALMAAEKNSAVVIPVFIEPDIEPDSSDVISRLQHMKGVVCENGRYDEAGDELLKIIEKLFSGFDMLEWYSEQVNNYIFVKKFDKALEFQKLHCNLCVDLCNFSNGKYVSLDAIINSRIRLISLLIDTKKWEDALSETVMALSMLDDLSEQGHYTALIEQFAICCIGCNFSEQEVNDIIEEKINIHRLEIEYQDKNPNQFNYDMCIDLMDEFKYKKAHKDTEIDKKKNDLNVTQETAQIAHYGKAAMNIFDGLINSELTEKARCSMIEGYQRVLNYCIQLGLSDQISSECIERIAELKQKEALKSEKNSAISGALKVFLGQAVPGSGNYDVFISFKSEDVELARKVYEFLKQNGKEVFFSKETLTQLGESEYEDAIYEALDHSKHLVLVGSNPEYFKTDWVSREWKYFNNKNRKSKTPGTFVIIMPDEYTTETEKLPPQLRYDFEIIKIEEFKNRLLSYLR